MGLVKGTPALFETDEIRSLLCLVLAMGLSRYPDMVQAIPEVIATSQLSGHRHIFWLTVGYPLPASDETQITV